MKHLILIIALLGLLFSCTTNEIEETKNTEYKDTSYKELFNNYEYTKSINWYKDENVFSEIELKDVLDVDMDLTMLIEFKDQHPYSITVNQEVDKHSKTTTVNVDKTLETVYNNEPIITELDSLYDATEYLLEEYLGEPMDDITDKVESGIKDAIDSIFGK